MSLIGIRHFGVVTGSDVEFITYSFAYRNNIHTGFGFGAVLSAAKYFPRQRTIASGTSRTAADILAAGGNLPQIYITVVSYKLGMLMPERIEASIIVDGLGLLQRLV